MCLVPFTKAMGKWSAQVLYLGLDLLGKASQGLGCPQHGMRFCVWAFPRCRSSLAHSILGQRLAFTTGAQMLVGIRQWLQMSSPDKGDVWMFRCNCFHFLDKRGTKSSVGYTMGGSHMKGVRIQEKVWNHHLMMTRLVGCGWTVVRLQVCDYKSKLTTVVIFPLT